MSEEKSSVREFSRGTETGKRRDGRTILIAFLVSIVVVACAEILGACFCRWDGDAYADCSKRKCGRSFGWKERSFATAEVAYCRRQLKLAERHLERVRQAHEAGDATLTQLTDAALERDLCLLKLWRYESGLPAEPGAVDAALKVAAARTKLLDAAADAKSEKKPGLLALLRHRYEAARAELQHLGRKIKAVHLWNHGAAALDDYPQGWDPDAMLMLFQAEYFPYDTEEIMVLTPIADEVPGASGTAKKPGKESAPEKKTAPEKAKVPEKAAPVKK